MHGYVDRWWRAPDGLRLYARDYPGAAGEARLPVVCLHGLTRNSADFGAVAPASAAAGRRVLALDVRGRGRSDRASDPMTYVPPVYAGDVAALMDQAGIARAAFVGTSMGGLITMTLAALRPDRVAAAVLNDIGPEVGQAGLARIAAYAGQPVEVETWADAAAYARRTNGVAFPHYGQADWDAFARRVFREDASGRPVLDYDPEIAAPIRAAGAQALTPDLWPAFRGLAEGRPLLLVRGQTSDLLDADIAGRMRAAAPHMGYVEVSGVGHAPMLDEPEAAAAIAAFLDALP